MPVITLHYFAAARAAAGVDTETVQASSVSQALQLAQDCHDVRFAEVLDTCSVLLDGVVVGNRDALLRQDAQLHVLPPFAGG